MDLPSWMESFGASILRTASEKENHVSSVVTTRTEILAYLSWLSGPRLLALTGNQNPALNPAKSMVKCKYDGIPKPNEIGNLAVGWYDWTRLMDATSSFNLNGVGLKKQPLRKPNKDSPIWRLLITILVGLKWWACIRERNEERLALVGVLKGALKFFCPSSRTRKVEGSSGRGRGKKTRSVLLFRCCRTCHELSWQ